MQPMRRATGLSLQSLQPLWRQESVQPMPGFCVQPVQSMRCKEPMQSVRRNADRICMQPMQSVWRQEPVQSLQPVCGQKSVQPVWRSERMWCMQPMQSLRRGSRRRID